MELNEIQTQVLLQRPVHPRNVGLHEKFLSGKNVLITGAGGSIGSELSRIVSPLAAKLTLVDRDEGRLHSIWRECGGVPALDDLSQSDSVEKLVSGQDIVFHAAALKHVPILEFFENAAYQTNVVTTQRLLKCTQAAKCESFTLISTDKAVEPKSVMGRSKRQAEDVVRTCVFATEIEGWTPTVANIVRFGNVLGSSGSVLEIWAEQTSQRRPITLTMPVMTRYFMSLSEAADLVISAAALKQGGTFVADMGHPINMMDMANNFLRLFGGHGLTEIPHRKGEKQDEKLHWPHERLVPTSEAHVMRVADGAEVS